MLGDWILRLCALAVMQMIGRALLPEGSLKRTVGFCLSLLFTAALLGPVFSVINNPAALFAG